jgi:D-threo-aldose 1-dehydrogenase
MTHFDGRGPAGDVASPAASGRVSLGRTAVRVSRLGFGGGPIGGLFQTVTELGAHEAIDAAWNAGIRYFDTAPHYGAGLSERRLGEYLVDKDRASFALSTKVGRLLVSGTAAEYAAEGAEFEGAPQAVRQRDYSRDGVRRSLDASLERLGLDRVDIVFVHDPDDHWQQAMDEAIPALVELRHQGVIGAVGVGMNQAEMLDRFVRGSDLDCVLVAGRYTLLDQQAATALLPACEQRHVAVVIGGVFNSGVLVDPYGQEYFDYRSAPPELSARARDLDRLCARFDVPLPAVAIQFALRHPATTSVLVGARSGAEVEQDRQWADVAVPGELWSALADAGVPMSTGRTRH